MDNLEYTYHFAAWFKFNCSSLDFRRGFRASNNGLKFDDSETDDWKAGFHYEISARQAE